MSPTMTPEDRAIREALAEPGVYGATGNVLDINRVEVNRHDLCSVLAAATRWRHFTQCGLPITYLGQEYTDIKELEARMDADLAAARETTQ